MYKEQILHLWGGGGYFRSTPLHFRSTPITADLKNKCLQLTGWLGVTPWVGGRINSLNLILSGYLSRKVICIFYNLITLFGIDRFLIECNKFLIFFHKTNLSMMFWLVKNVVAYFPNITFWYRESRTGILPFKFTLTKFIFIDKPFRTVRHYRGDCFFRNGWWPGDQKVHVFRVCIDGVEMTFIVFNYSGDVFFDTLPMRLNDQWQPM